ncbi:MAG TPA: TetR/AcrR family transcriptional regulator [Solirubrobacterales bacterium]
MGGVGHQREEAERGRICAAMIAVAADRGYEAASIDDVVSRANVDRETFARHFEGLEDCFSAAWTALDAELRERMGSAFDSRLEWTDRLRAALSEGMEILAADERRARFYVSEVLRVDDRMRARQHLAMDRLSVAIDMGREGPDSDPAPQGVADAISGAIWHRVHQLVQSGRTSELPAQVPRFMYLAVLPYRGSSAAQAELNRS